MYEIRDGWVRGQMPGVQGSSHEVEKQEGPRPGGQPFIPLVNPRVLVLHTTEGSTVDGAVSTLRSKFSPPHFVVGEDRIVQMRPLTVQAATLRDNGGEFRPNSVGWQVEAVGRTIHARPQFEGGHRPAAWSVSSLLGQPSGVALSCGNGLTSSRPGRVSGPAREPREWPQRLAIVQGTRAPAASRALVGVDRAGSGQHRQPFARTCAA